MKRKYASITLPSKIFHDACKSLKVTVPYNEQINEDDSIVMKEYNEQMGQETGLWSINTVKSIDRHQRSPEMCLYLSK